MPGVALGRVLVDEAGAIVLGGEYGTSLLAIKDYLNRASAA
jgi:hypothetical protein